MSCSVSTFFGCVWNEKKNTRAHTHAPHLDWQSASQLAFNSIYSVCVACMCFGMSAYAVHGFACSIRIRNLTLFVLIHSIQLVRVPRSVCVCVCTRSRWIGFGVAWLSFSLIEFILCRCDDADCCVVSRLPTFIGPAYNNQFSMIRVPCALQFSFKRLPYSQWYWLLLFLL